MKKALRAVLHPRETSIKKHGFGLKQTKFKLDRQLSIPEGKQEGGSTSNHSLLLDQDRADTQGEGWSDAMTPDDPDSLVCLLSLHLPPSS